MNMYPRHFAEVTPEKTAVMLSGSGNCFSFAELEDKANQAAHLFRSNGLKAGDKVAFLLPNCIDVFPFCWGAQRAGLLFVPIPTKSTLDEVAYLIEDSGATLLLASTTCPAVQEGDFSTNIPAPAKYILETPPSKDWEHWETAMSNFPTYPIADEIAGQAMLYSSGTTGRPKGIAPQVGVGVPLDEPDILCQLMSQGFHVSNTSVFLSPAPLYHAAPLRWTMCAQALGAKTIIMPRFDPVETLATIESEQVTDAQFVPTHFVRMLKMPEADRRRYDVSSMRMAVHAAAPCPIEIKQEMFDWWGDVIYEYYAGSEGVGMTLATPEGWKSHPGTVGKAILGTAHICDEAGEPLPVGDVGQVYFESDIEFSYHNDAPKTQSVYNQYGWSSYGDIGYLDEDNFLYLTDRKSFMIISGGVNIYPQEIENLLITHPDVSDVAVIGAPDHEFGEKVVAIIQPANLAQNKDALRKILNAHCRKKLSAIKVPKQIDFLDVLPRTETGKMMKRYLRNEYWGKNKGA
jgi:acyl-CoA synthetase (AMP-forming)/AMP-acid ligase II